MTKKPNLFNFATSELSQDAFICWLLSFANYNSDEPIVKTSKFLINKLTNNQISHIENVIVKKQVKHLDILCVINDKYAILIEDKVNTKNHSNQLEKYYIDAKKKYEEKNIYPIYLKTGDQSSYESIIKNGYVPFLRTHFLEVLNFGIENGVNSDIFLDFKDYLQIKENNIGLFKTTPFKEWGYNGNIWTGFFIELQKSLNTGNWNYVPQKNSGFMAFVWNWKHFKNEVFDFHYYIQLEWNKFCFKIIPKGGQKQRETRDFYRAKLYKIAKENNISLKQNGRIGKSMTVAILTKNIFICDKFGMIDIEKTTEEIKTINKFFEQI
jgi:hypothetical protein